MGVLSKVKDDNFYVTFGWMRQAGLKGTELAVYAIIYGFSQAENQCYDGSLAYLSEWVGKQKGAIISALKSLQEKGFIAKREIFQNGVKFCEYRALVNSENRTGGSKIVPGQYENRTGGGSEIVHNNIEDIDIDNIDIYMSESLKKSEPDYQGVIDNYNNTCKSLPQVKKVTDGRKKAIKGILNKYTTEELDAAFETAEKSDFLSGRKGGWSASFDWLMKDANLAKVLEGNYSNRGQAPQAAGGSIFAGL